MWMIVVTLKTSETYVYGPFKSTQDAGDWADDNLQYQYTIAQWIEIK